VILNYDQASDKLKNHTIEKNEAIELQNILQKEQSEATTLGNLAIIIGTSILLGLMAETIYPKINLIYVEFSVLKNLDVIDENITYPTKFYN
jgi:hypothetical protein